MHTIQYRLLTVVLAFGLFGTLLGCDGSQVTFVSEDVTDMQVSETTTQIQTEDSQDFVEDVEELKEIPVYVCGAVNHPGVYYLSVGSLKKDALELAGGFTEDACREYVNLAEVISEGEQIYFPTLSEIDTWEPIYNVSGASPEDDRVNINSATREQLMTLPGIGQSKADAIIAYREKYGPFQTTEDLLSVSGIKDGVYQKIKDYIVAD